MEIILVGIPALADVMGHVIDGEYAALIELLRIFLGD